MSVTRLTSALLCKKGEQIKMLFGVNTPGGPWSIVLDVGSDPSQRGKGSPFFGPPVISGTAEARDLKFCLHTQRGGGSNENYATVGHMWIRVWVT